MVQSKDVLFYSNFFQAPISTLLSLYASATNCDLLQGLQLDFRCEILRHLLQIIFAIQAHFPMMVEYHPQ